MEEIRSQIFRDALRWQAPANAGNQISWYHIRRISQLSLRVLLPILSDFLLYFFLLFSLLCFYDTSVRVSLDFVF